MSYIESILKERGVPDFMEGVRDKETFIKKQDDIRKLLSEKEYGVIPPVPDHLDVEIVNEYDNFCAGRGVLRNLLFHIEMNGEHFSFEALSAIPKSDTKVPAFVNLRFIAENRYFPLEEICDSGFAVFSFKYTDVTSDDGNFKDKCAKYLVKSRRKSNASGKLAIWAWAAMRVMDYVMTLPEIDTENVAVVGHSRLGKTALLTGAFDSRFKYVISNDSGCAGAAIERGKVGETYKRIAEVFPYWFCPSFVKAATEERELPFDQSFLLSLSVPRHIIVASAEEDLWADPASEFLGVASINPAYKLFGMKGLIHGDVIPEPTTLLSDGDSCYFIRHGTHYFSREDWHAYMRIIKERMNK